MTTKKSSSTVFRERLKVVKGEPQNEFGSEVHLVLTGVDRGANTYLAIMTLRRNGMSLPEAKRTVDAAMDGETVPVIVPKVQNPDGMMAELAEYGVRAQWARTL